MNQLVKEFWKLVHICQSYYQTSMGIHFLRHSVEFRLHFTYLWHTSLHQSSSSSRMRVMNHNWSATKQRLHPQSVAEISRHSVSSKDRIRHQQHTVTRSSAAAERLRNALCLSVVNFNSTILGVQSFSLLLLVTSASDLPVLPYSRNCWLHSTLHESSMAENRDFCTS